MRVLEANIPTTENRELVLDLILKIPKLDSSREQLDVWLKLNLGTDIFGAWLAIEEDEPVGVLTCEIIEQNIDPKAYLSFWSPRLKELLDKCEEWAKQREINKLVFYTKSTKRILGFKTERIVMTKDIQCEKTNV